MRKKINFSGNNTIDWGSYYKVCEKHDLLNDALQHLGIFSKHLSMDEQIVCYYGRHGCKMFMKVKSV